MKNVLVLGFFVLTLLSLQSFTSTSHVGGFDAILNNVKNTKQYTLDVLRAMPEGKYAYKPTSDVRTFAEQAAHIAYATEGFKDMFMRKNPEWKLGDGTQLSKKELIELNEKNFDQIIGVIESAPYNDGLHAGIISFLDHNAHHRGQMIIYLRMSGIKPPEYK